MSDTPLLYTVTGALERIPISRAKLYVEISAGRIVPVKIGRRTYFSETELRRYVEALPTMKAAA